MQENVGKGENKEKKAAADLKGDRCFIKVQLVISYESRKKLQF